MNTGERIPTRWEHAEYLDPLAGTAEGQAATAAHRAVDEFLAATFPAASTAPFRSEWTDLGPHTLPPQARVRTQRFGQAFELTVAVGIRTRWPEPGPGFLLRLEELLADRKVRRAVKAGDSATVAVAALRVSNVWPSHDEIAIGAVTPEVFAAYVADLVELEANLWRVLDTAGVGDGPFLVGVEDLFCGGCLLDLKVNSGAKFSPRWLADIGRRLLDLDRLGGLMRAVERVGIYSARHPALLIWDADEFLGALTGGADRVAVEADYSRLCTTRAEADHQYGMALRALRG